jgi:hypothetical protein
LVIGKQTLSDLSLGVEVPNNSPLFWTPESECTQVPIALDSASGAKLGEDVQINGVNAKVREIISGSSATNRIGVEMSLEAMGLCLQKSSLAPYSGIALDASPEKAVSILKKANLDHEAADVVTKSQYEKNSTNFWNANVLPLISILELSSLALVGVYASTSTKEQISKSRKEWAVKSAQGVSDNIIRSTEFLRATKDGVIASILGGSATALVTPEIVNSLVSGINYSVGFNNLMVGAAVGIGGSMLGAAMNLRHPQRLVDVVENTRA